MTNINDWRLSKKMTVAFGFIAVMLTAIGMNTMIANRQLTSVATRHVERGIGGTDALGRVISALREDRIIVYSLATNDDDARIPSYRERYARNSEELQSALSAYEPMAGEFMPKVEQLKREIAVVDEDNADIFAERERNGRMAAVALVKGDALENNDAAVESAQELIRLHALRSKAADEAGQSTGFNSLLFSSALLLLTLGVLYAVWRVIDRTVAQPLGEVSKATTILADGGKADVPHRDRKDELGEVAKAVELFRMAAVTRAEADARIAEEQKVVTASLGSGLSALKEGDLTAQITADFPAGYAELKVNFNEALDALRQLIGAVNESAAGIRTGSGEIAHASEDLARRTEGNAASLEETAASLTQIDGRLKATTVAAGRTVERADGAIASVNGGRAVADEAVQAMGRVSESAKGIDSVIEGLDKIAFQTRVLAMNAAVEAGRAGDAGRGFAVVADLVSALAMRSEEEAKRARDQLTATQTDIGMAVEAVTRVDSAFADISEGVGEVHHLLNTMAADNQAQSSAVTQISAAIGAMDQSTQQNAAMVEETSAAARNLTTEVDALAEKAARFKVGGGSSVVRQKPANHNVVASPAKPQPSQPQPYISPVKPMVAKVANAFNAVQEDWSDF